MNSEGLAANLQRDSSLSAWRRQFYSILSLRDRLIFFQEHGHSLHLRNLRHLWISLALQVEVPPKNGSYPQITQITRMTGG
jgi:hypothetical protein